MSATHSLEDIDIPSSPPLPRGESSQARFRPRSQDTYATRVNRYHGPASTWLTYTKEERAIVESLDDEHAQDLSLHLLNAHGLQQRASDPDGAQQTTRKGMQPGQVGADPEDDHSVWRPHRRWTAWPLPPEQVPRDTEISQSGYGSVSAPDHRPSAWLEEQLFAHVTKVARRRWEARTWAVTAEAAGKGANSGKKRVSPPRSTSRSNTNAASDHKSTSKATTPAAATDVTETWSSDSELGEGMITSQVYLADSDEEAPNTSKAGGHHSDDSEDEDMTPVPIADDEVAKKLLLPSIRHTMSRFDDLLLALHKARKSYSTGLPRHNGDYDTEDAETTATDTSRPRKRRRTRSRSRSRFRDSAPPANQANPAEPPKRALGLRDWSDIVGMAAIIGWDTDVVGRVSEKCANLFNENMTFRTFHEPNETSKGPTWEETFASTTLAGTDPAQEDEGRSPYQLPSNASGTAHLANSATETRRNVNPTPIPTRTQPPAFAANLNMQPARASTSRSSALSVLTHTASAIESPSRN
ncbi:uncharacterized protein AB675_407 [Cyphellophora attinorum]|uniref:Rrn9 domain-containing protein n=1 Tax=Cyphellophora attinorum TaxID=1664694 RepID=A0A0N1HC15_9EURO|nr:uncharacterized protein AB675_407 [Phialophora attinorum]KPI45877.1 hypothetical protein AB675_407 [Phialophora attinorum]